MSRYEDWRIPRLFTCEGDLHKRLNLELTGDLDDLDNVNRQLKPIGIRIIDTMRETEVIVIKDR